VEEVSNELLRTRVWLESDQRNYWNKEIRLLGRQLEEAEQALFAARLSTLETKSALQEMAVQRLKRKLRDAEDKQHVTRNWSRALEDRAAPMLKEVESLQSFLAIEMGRALAHLDQVVKTLDAYARVAPAGLASGGSTGAGEQPQASQDAPREQTGHEGEPS
jgi:uncharacterized coiled-coil protein SlyX